MTDQSLRAARKWQSISKNIKLAENIIRRNQLKVYWPNIFQFQKVSVDFIREFITIVTDQDLWDVIAQYQTLDLDFIREYKDEFDWDIILEFQSLTTRSVPPDNAVASNVGLHITNPLFTFPKSRFRSTVTELSTFTTMTLLGCNITGNNKSYNIISVEEIGDNIEIETDTSYDFVGVTFFGWMEFPESESGDVTFLEEAVIVPLLHKDSNVSRPFRDALSKSQSLTNQYIVDNDQNLNLTLLSQNQNLTDFFIAKYDIDSTVTDAIPSITFDWEQLVIGQDLLELLESPNYPGWVKTKLNFQLLLKYQNLSRTFVFANLTDLQLPELGRFNRNLSDADLQQIEDDNPALSETTDRPDSIKFNYDYGDIVTDLNTAGFEFEDGRPVGYIFYHRNGSMLNKRNKSLDVQSGTQVSIPQVDLSDVNPRGRNGISVINGDTLVSNAERQSYKIAKVAVPIVSRNIDQSATGTIGFSPKSSYSEFDRFTVSDTSGKVTFEFDESGDGISSASTIYNRIVFTSDGILDTITVDNPHRFKTGDSVLIEGGSLPSPLITGTTYYIINAGDVQIRLAANREDALNNVPFSVDAGSGDIVRQDNAFAITDDIIIYNKLVIFNPTVGENKFDTVFGGTEIFTSYYIVKLNKYTFRLATSEEKVDNNDYLTITSKQNGYAITTNALSINFRSTDIIRSSDVATIQNRVINKFKRIELLYGIGTFDIDPWYTTVKNGESEYTTNWDDYTATFTADPVTNVITLNDTIPIENGDPLSFTGTLPSPLSPGTIYYAIVITNTTLEVAANKEDANSRIAINLTTSGNGNIFPARISLTTDISLHTGNRVQVTSTTLPTGITDSDVYYVNVINSKTIELCSTLDNAFDGIPIALQQTGSDLKTIVAEDYNFDYSGAETGKGIVHFVRGSYLYVELVTDTNIIAGDDISIRTSGIVTPINIESVIDILDLSSVQNNDTINITSNLPSNQKSQGNIPMERFTTNPNIIKVSGMSGGFEDTIVDANARGVGVVIEDLGRLRAFSVEVLDNDYFNELRF